MKFDPWERCTNSFLPSLPSIAWSPVQLLENGSCCPVKLSEILFRIPLHLPIQEFSPAFLDYFVSFFWDIPVQGHELDLMLLPAQDTSWFLSPGWNRWIHPWAWKKPKCLLSLDRINQWKTMLQHLPSDLFCPQKLDCSFLSSETCPGTAQSSAQMLAPVGLGSVQQLTEKFKGI